jgi:hypothetical protein
MELCKDFPKVVDALARNAPKGKRGGDRRSEEAKTNQKGVPTFDRNGTTKTKPVLEAKLAERHPEVWEGYLNGEYTSVRAAAEAAGLVRPANDPVARLKSNWRKATAAQRRAFLTWTESEGN